MLCISKIQNIIQHILKLSNRVHHLTKHRIINFSYTKAYDRSIYNFSGCPTLKNYQLMTYGTYVDENWSEIRDKHQQRVVLIMSFLSLTLQQIILQKPFAIRYVPPYRYLVYKK